MAKFVPEFMHALRGTRPTPGPIGKLGSAIANGPIGQGASALWQGTKSTVGSVVGFLPRKSASIGLWVVEQPFAYGMKGIRILANGARTHPLAAGVVALGAGALAFGSGFRNRAEQRTKQDLLSQASVLQQGNPYQVSPEDAAALEARMKQGGRNGGFAQAELAARGSAQDQATVR